MTTSKRSSFVKYDVTFIPISWLVDWLFERLKVKYGAPNDVEPEYPTPRNTIITTPVGKITL